jgi:phage repressor protein C with HTH and peptisase S24 domain
MAVSDNARKLKELRNRAGITTRGLAKMLKWSAHTRVQYYEDEFKGEYLPQGVVKEIAPHLVGRGRPPIRDEEVFALAGMAPAAPESEQTTLLLAPRGQVPQAPAAPVNVPRVPDVPVWASVSAGDEDGTMILTERPIDWIHRSDAILHVADPFAFYIVGDSMEDRFYQGDMGVVNRSAPLTSGADCVFIHQADDGTIYGLVKSLMRSAGESWLVRQLNPRKDFTLSKRKWNKVYRIVETRHRA